LGLIQCTIIDPLLRKRGKELSRKDKKRLKKLGAPEPHHIAQEFNSSAFLNDDENQRLIKNATCVVGLHPDECTEDIIDVALRYNKSFAIIPCCVFARKFSSRCLINSPSLTEGFILCSVRAIDAAVVITKVRTYDHFIKYLMRKDPRIMIKHLPFEGKNKVIYFKRQ